MDNQNTITISPKYKHLSFEHYDHIIREIVKHDAFHNGVKRNTGRTKLIKELAFSVGTSPSNVYAILKDAMITVKNTNLVIHQELSATAAFNKRTKTIYNYVHQGKILLKPIDLPRMLRRKPKKNYKEYIPKRQKGTPISERPFEMDDRSEFGHWEGDLVTGPRDGQKGAYLTLIERKTRYYIMIPINRKSSKQVYMKINQLHKFYEDTFSTIFKSITFDNGSEFSRYKDIEQKIGHKEKRTSVYFGRPYHSCDRASNENCNGFIRYFIKKGTDINTVNKALSTSINKQINNKKRKILGYISAEESFQNELNNLDLFDALCFYA